MRRSPAVYCYTPLPLDLHVLSLPLAFILSQDQTLHCKNCLYFLTFDSSVSLRPASPDFRHTLSLHLRNSMFSRFPEPPPKGAVLRRKRVQRYDLFSNCQIFFRIIYPGCRRMVCRTAVCTRKKIFDGARKRPGKSRKKEKNTAFFTVLGVCLPDKKRYVCVFCCFSVIYGIFIVRVFCRIVFHLFVAQYLTKAFNKGYFPIFLSTVPSAQLFISCPTLSCRPFPVNGALPCPLFHAKAKNTDSFNLLYIIEDSTRWRN